MYIQCTKALLERMKLKNADLIEVPEDDGASGLFSWHANIATINRKKAVIFVNNHTKYPVFLYGCKGKDFDKLGEIFASALRCMLSDEGVPDEYIDEYLKRCGEVNYSKTSCRETIGTMTSMTSYIKCYEHIFNKKELFQPCISRKLADTFVKYGKKRYLPYERMVKAITEFFGIGEEDYNDFLSIKAYQLKIRLLLDNYEVWRSVLIPARADFDALHRVIQQAFDWRGNHLYEFLVPESSDADFSSYDFSEFPIKMYIKDFDCMTVIDFWELDEEDTKDSQSMQLSDVFGDVNRIYYMYDFGASWMHEVSLEKVVTLNKGVCSLLEACGDTPPEDIGWEILECQKEKRMSFDEINRKLSYIGV